MKRRIEIEPGYFRDVEKLADLYDPEVTLVCAKCGTDMEIFRHERLEAEPGLLKPAYLVRCAKDERHFVLSFHHRLPGLSFGDS